MKIYLATNNGDIGGGEVMLFNIARGLKSLGHQVTIIAPKVPSQVGVQAQQEGFDTVILPAKNRKDYILKLRWWSLHKRNDSLLWCNGLVPSFATAGEKNRIVHLHQVPEGIHKLLARVSKYRALKVLVPSIFATRKVPQSQCFYNWVTQVENFQPHKLNKTAIRVGFLGRPSDFKGTQFVAQAIKELNEAQQMVRYQLVIGGESRFVPEQESKELIPALKALGCDLIELGWVKPEEFFSQIDIATVPSNWDEVFGLVAAESMSAKIPLIISDAGALPEILGEDYPLTVTRARPDELAKVIEETSLNLVKRSAGLEQAIEANYKRWNKFFSPAAGEKNLSQLISSINPSK